MYGFKSFPDRTKLTFEQGTTVIVGPNGSGKSNIADAMKWVLGEISTKSIRGAKMEDIIFSGTESRKPMGFAEVSVTFDNTDPENRLDCPYDEVTVTRRYYRAGESEYFINRRAVRLRDIYELFMNTGIGRDGYSIIGQGKIAEIISRKSEERRGIFEDASGIAKFRFKKNAAEKKLAQTQDNLTRVNDIFLEVEKQIGPLEKEAEKAKKAIVLTERKKEADIRLWLYDSERLRTEIEKLSEILSRADFDVQNLADALEDIRQQSERLLEKSQSNKSDSERLYNEIRMQTDENFRLESDYRLAERNVTHIRELCDSARESLARYAEMIENEKRAIEQRRAQIESGLTRLEELSEQQENLNAAKVETLKRIQTLKSMADDIFADISALEEELNGIRTQIAVMQNSNTAGSDKNASAEKEIEKYSSANEDLTRQCEDKERLLAYYTANINSLAESIQELRERLAEQTAVREQNMQALSSMIFNRDSIAQRIETYRSLEEQFDGYISSVKYVMKCYAEGGIKDRYGNPAGTVYGPLSKVISVEDEFVIAIETALGASLQHVVVENEETAKAAMLALKTADKGRATFFPLTSMKGQSPSKEVTDAAGFEGFVSTADKLVTCEGKFKNIVSSLLGRTAVFDNVDNANKAAKALGYRIRIVTLDGQQINVGGSFTGGSVNRRGGVLSRVAEIRRLESEMAELEKSVASSRAEVETLDDVIEDINVELEEKENNKQLVEAMASSVVPMVEKLKAQIEANCTLIDKMNEELARMRSMHAEYEERIAELEAESDQLLKRISELKTLRSDKSIEANSAEDELSKINADLTELLITVSGVHKDLDTENAFIKTSQDKLAELESSVESLEQKIEGYLSRIEELKEKCIVNRQMAAEGEQRLAALTEQRASIEQTGSDFEARLSEINKRTTELIAQKESAYSLRTVTAAKLETLQAEEDKLLPMLFDLYGLTRADALELGYPPISDSERESWVAVQTECKNKLRYIGSVDFDAVSKYESIKERYDTMSEQLADLREAEAKILNEIKGLERNMEKTFKDAFDRINENFGKVFKELFGGGHAEILLTEPDDVLSSGIEIKAAPPGKIIKSLMQLSGGEQSFVAIALFFATLQVNPTPFCILDEIEAALDDANVARFASYIKRYSNETQFILISHRRGTMEAAERLYGVTMPERGISKILGLVLSEIARKGEKELDGLFR